MLDLFAREISQLSETGREGGEGGAAPSPHPACAGVIIKI